MELIPAKTVLLRTSVIYLGLDFYTSTCTKLFYQRSWKQKEDLRNGSLLTQITQSNTFNILRYLLWKFYTNFKSGKDYTSFLV